MKRVIYTVITGNYDKLKEPLLITPGWDYVCFTDQDIKSDGWKIIQLGKTEEKCRYQRSKKIYNKWIFDNYDLSIYIDGSMQINENLTSFVTAHGKKDFSLMNHPSRNCIYDEFVACKAIRKGDPKIMFDQIQRYLREGYPPDNGMVATGILIRKHTVRVERFCKAWLKEVEEGSLRDQLSFNYVAHNLPLDYHTFPFGVLMHQFKLHRHA